MKSFGDQIRIPCVIYRGGTSRAVFMKRNDLPKDAVLRDKIVLNIFGSPDPRQIDGLGGADPLTSKFALIGPPTRRDADVDYTFAQVSVTQPIVDWRGNCGNISAAVGPFAIDEGLVDAKEPETVIRIHQTNMKRIIIAKVPVKDGKAKVEGNYAIPGVPGTGAKITLDFYDFGGSLTGKLLPTGNVKDWLKIDDMGTVEVSVVDAANPVVFIRAKDLGLKGTENPMEIDADKSLLERVERIRGTIAQLIGLVEDWKEAASQSPYIPFIALIREPTSYASWTTGERVRSEQIDVVSRLIFMGVAHKTYPVTGTVATGVSAKMPGSIVYEAVPEEALERTEVRIGHPAGVITTEVEMTGKEPEFVIKRAVVGRTARRIMDGYVHIQASLLEKA